MSLLCFGIATITRFFVFKKVMNYYWLYKSA